MLIILILTWFRIKGQLLRPAWKNKNGAFHFIWPLLGLSFIKFRSDLSSYPLFSQELLELWSIDESMNILFEGGLHDMDKKGYIWKEISFRQLKYPVQTKLYCLIFTNSGRQKLFTSDLAENPCTETCWILYGLPLIQPVHLQRW